MKPLPGSEKPLLVRTDFSNDEAWQAICSNVGAPPSEVRGAMDQLLELNAMMGLPDEGADGFVDPVDDSAYAKAEPAALIGALPTEHGAACLFVADQLTMTHADHPLLVVDLMIERGRTFRTIPSEVWAIDSNLSICNMDWEDFADHVDAEGVFRGFEG